MIIYNLIHILNTMKTNEKIHYIKSLDDGDKDLFLWFSNIVLNPMLSFYITELSLVDTDDEIGTFSLADGINKLMYLNDKGSSSKQDIIELNNIYSAMLPYNQ